MSHEGQAAGAQSSVHLGSHQGQDGNSAALTVQAWWEVGREGLGVALWAGTLWIFTALGCSGGAQVEQGWIPVPRELPGAKLLVDF